MKRYVALRSELIKGGNLPLKTKRLILVAASAAAKCQHCVEMHTIEAIKEGIPEQEIIEAISLAYLVGGAPALVAGSKALEVFEREIVY
ncbi:carboxymuconolactone decarboxylase family protein [Candidatus Bathyarchaeota archaeon]|nr:carboxymuconolactone decarboxylase family protein [Candidatus Bathyarchaeota archaeon]